MISEVSIRFRGSTGATASRRSAQAGFRISAPTFSGRIRTVRPDRKTVSRKIAAGDRDSRRGSVTLSLPRDLADTPRDDMRVTTSSADLDPWPVSRPGHVLSTFRASYFRSLRVSLSSRDVLSSIGRSVSDADMKATLGVWASIAAMSLPVSPASVSSSRTAASPLLRCICSVASAADTASFLWTSLISSDAPFVAAPMVAAAA